MCLCSRGGGRRPGGRAPRRDAVAETRSKRPPMSQRWPSRCRARCPQRRRRRGRGGSATRQAARRLRGGRGGHRRPAPSPRCACSRGRAVVGVEDAVEVAGHEDVGAGRTRRSGRGASGPGPRRRRPARHRRSAHTQLDDRPVLAGGGVRPADAQDAAGTGRRRPGRLPRVRALSGCTRSVRRPRLGSGPSRMATPAGAARRHGPRPGPAAPWPTRAGAIAQPRVRRCVVRRGVLGARDANLGSRAGRRRRPPLPSLGEPVDACGSPARSGAVRGFAEK